MKFPTLYKKTSTGAIQYWTISVLENSDHSTGYDIWTHYGQVGGKEQQTVDSILEGKNVGKKNETTPQCQAFLEAKAKWQKQKKKGYVETVEAAEAETTDELIEGGIVPMLAHKFSDHAHKIKYPAFVQPKLDGIRCIAIINEGKCTLWSRTRKQITSMPHIVSELERAFGNSKDLIFDGELYNHRYKSNFEHIVSLVRQEEPDPRHTDVEYHIYDVVKDIPFIERARVLQILRKEPFLFTKFVVTEEVYDEPAVSTYFNIYKELGYEGCMVRNQNSKYVNKRSYDLLKVKEFDDAEFDIIGVEEGRGKLTGHVGAFVCRTTDGKEFLAKMSGDTGKLKEYFENHGLWQGKRLTVQFQGLTGKEQVPRFPVGVSIRDYE